MRLRLAILPLMQLSLPVSPQQKIVDSLQQVLLNGPTDSAKYRVLKALSSYYGESNRDALHYYEQAYAAHRPRKRLGLLVSNDIVRTHGSEWSVEAKVGERTIFIIQLPGIEPSK